MFHGSGWWSYLRYDESRGRPSLDRQLLRRVLGYARPYTGRMIAVVATIIAIALLELIPPLLYRDLIDNILPNRDLERLKLLALGLLGIPIASGLMGVAQRYLSASVGESIIFDLRQEMYEHLQRMSLRFFTQTKSGVIISRFNNDVVGAQTAIAGTLPNIVTNGVTLVSTLAVMLSIEWRLTALAVAVLPLFLLPAKRVGRILRDIRRRAMEYNADMSSIIQETLSINGALLVKTFGRQADEVERFRQTNRRVRDIGVRRALVGRWFFMGLGMAAAIGTALVYWVGGYLAITSDPNAAGAVTAGTLVAFAAYLTRLYGPISALSNVQVEFVSSMVSFERVFEYLDLPVEIADRPGATVLSKVEGHIRFQEVWFSYGPADSPVAAVDSAAGLATEARGEPALAAPGKPGHGRPAAGDAQGSSASGGGDGNGSADDGRGDSRAAADQARQWALAEVSFEIEPGQLVALVGPSGAGKTSLVYLLLRLYDPTLGCITLDGHDLCQVTLASLARQFGVVMQETYLFHDTVMANLLYARPDATAAEVAAACRAANIHELIASLPDGYDTVVGERGYRLSGGEKQRLAIARVILKDPRVLILDEATSHLDSHSEALIQAALEPLLAGRTSIVIAHRLSTVTRADKILVLDEGRLVEEGDHASLLARGGLYAHLHATQFQRAA